eukprot:5406571-Amphidinium_carterae.1
MQNNFVVSMMTALATALRPTSMLAACMALQELHLAHMCSMTTYRHNTAFAAARTNNRDKS